LRRVLLPAVFGKHQFLSVWNSWLRKQTSRQSFKLANPQCHWWKLVSQSSASPSHCILHAFGWVCPDEVLNQLGCNHKVAPTIRISYVVHLHEALNLWNLRYGMPDQTDSFSLSKSMCYFDNWSSIFLTLLSTLYFWSSVTVALKVIASKWASLISFLLTTCDSMG
jgi:hypothetical protein